MLGSRQITGLTLVDLVEPELDREIGLPVQTRSVDLTNAASIAPLIAAQPDVIYHLAAVVSGEAEANFDKGYLVNFTGTQLLFDLIRQQHMKNGYCPKVIFTSSIAVFGGPYPETLPDTFFANPSNSYGAQKAMAELLLTDLSRRRILDGIALRLPTICIRPGAPNKAASGFFSGILREPLAGVRAVLPVPDTVRAWLASPRSAVSNMRLAGSLDTGSLGHQRVLNLPGLSATVVEQIEALRSVAGQSAVDLITPEPDETITNIVSSWPPSFEATRARALGFVSEKSVDEIIQVYIEDELGAQNGDN